MHLRPLHDRLVVRKKPEPTVSRGGIILVPSEMSPEKAIEGTVLAVGPGLLRTNGERRSMSVRVGERIIFNKYSGFTVKIDDEELVVLQEMEVLAHGDPSSDEALQPDATASA